MKVAAQRMPLEGQQEHGNTNEALLPFPIGARVSRRLTRRRPENFFKKNLSHSVYSPYIRILLSCSPAVIYCRGRATADRDTITIRAKPEARGAPPEEFELGCRLKLTIPARSWWLFLIATRARHD